MMQSTLKTDRLLWQHPYVNLFKQFKIEDWKRATKEGDVTSTMDKILKCTVYKIQGSVPAGNYIQFPRTSTQSLGLTGRYMYILFKPIPTKYFVVHTDVVTQDALVVRISFSNLFKEFKSTSTWLQFPFACQAARDSVEHFASLGAKQDFVGPAPISQKWTMLVLDLQYILSVYINRKYSFVKNLRLCANLLVKNCFTSDLTYDPRLSIKQARSMGIRSIDENFAPMPRDMNFTIPKDKEWDELYDVVRFPVDDTTSSKALRLPFDSIQSTEDATSGPLLLSHQNAISNSDTMKPPGVMKSPRRKMSRDVDFTRRSGLFISSDMKVSTNTLKEPTKKTKVTTDLPSVELSLLDTTTASCSDANVMLTEAKDGHVHVFVGESSPDREMVVHRHFPDSVQGNRQVSMNLRNKHTKFSSRAALKHLQCSHNKPISTMTEAHPDNDLSGLQPDPILKLQRVIGFGSGSANDVRSYRSLSAWCPAVVDTGHDIIVYAVHAIVIAMDSNSGHQHFFMGHTEDVKAIAFNDAYGGSQCILASAQGGKGGMVRIWRFETQKCVSIIRSQHAMTMSSLAFSRTGAVLVGVGRDRAGKTLVMVWNTSAALRQGSASVIAKAHTDAEVSRIRFCPTDDTRLATCGRDNIRFWRVRSNQLRSCPVVLPTGQGLHEITDVTFAPLGIVASSSQPDKREDSYSVFASTSGGYVVEVDFQRVSVRGLHKLHPPVTRNDGIKGISLNTLRFTEHYLATGSVDGVLRLWPLDLKNAFLEAEHEGPISDIDISADEKKVLVATNSATLGYLDVSTRKYKTVMRSHSDVIRDSCMDGLRRTISTCSDDCSIRVWDCDSLRQLYDFATPEDTPSVLSCHPMLEIFACGFLSGAVRVFHVGSTTVLSEHSNTKNKVSYVIFTTSGERLVSCDEKGTLALYNTSNIENVGASLLRSLPKMAVSGNDYGPNNIAISPDGRKIAFIGPNQYTITISTASMLDELMRIDVSTGGKVNADSRLKPNVDIPQRLLYSPSNLKQLLVVTKSSKLLQIDARTGQLLSTTANIHRGHTTSLCMSADGRHLVTAGDHLIKVWDYRLLKEFYFQAFIGHSMPIHSIMFTPDHLGVITIGEDAILVWDFLGGDRIPRNHPTDPSHVIAVGTNGREPIPTLDVEHIESEKDIDEDEDTLEPRSVLPASEVDQSSWVPPETLHTSDLDASDVSEFIVDARMMERLAENQKKASGKQGKSGDVTNVTKRLKDFQIDEENMEEEDANSDESDEIPIKVAWMGKTQYSPERPDPISLTPLTSVTELAERPKVLSHFVSKPSVTQAPQRTYTAPKGSEGLELKAVIGYNGNGRSNVVWNPDTGALAYTCGCVVILERLASNKKFNMFGHTEEVSCLALQHDGQIMASASGSNGLVRSRICLWDTKTLSCRATLKHHDFGIVALAYSRDDRFLVSVGDYRENLVVVWSAFDGLSSPIAVVCTKTKSPIHKVVWDPSTSNEFVTVGGKATLNFWLIDEHGHEQTALNVHPADVPYEVRTDETNEQLVQFTAACFGEDHILYIASNNGYVSAWDTRKNTCFLNWRADAAEICVMQSRGSRLLVAGASRGARMWSLAGIGEVRYTKGFEGDVVMENELNVNAEVISGVFDETLDIGIVGTTAGTLWYLDWNDVTTVRMVTGHKDKISDIAFDEGYYFATGSHEGAVRLWNIKTLEVAAQFQVIDHACTSLIFSNYIVLPLSPSSITPPKMLAAGYQDGTVRVFDIDKLALKLKLHPHSSKVTSVQFAASNKTLLSGAMDGTVAATSITTGVTLRILRDHKGAPINNISCSLRTDHPASLTVRGIGHDPDVPDEPRLCLMCGGDRRVSVWDTAWEHDVCDMIDWLTFPAPCFAPDGRQLEKNKKSLIHLPPSVCYFHPTNPDMLIYCGYGMNKSIQLYSLTARKVVNSLPIPNWSECMAISPDGNLIATGTTSRLLELIDGNHGTFQDYAVHSGAVHTVRFSPDGKLLLSASGSELMVWRVKK